MGITEILTLFPTLIILWYLLFLLRETDKKKSIFLIFFLITAFLALILDFISSNLFLSDYVSYLIFKIVFALQITASICLFLFSRSLIGKKISKLTLITVILIIISSFLYIVFTNQVYSGIYLESVYDPLPYEKGPNYLLFDSLTSFFLILSTLSIYQKFRGEKNKLQKNQLGTILLAFFMISLGAISIFDPVFHNEDVYLPFYYATIFNCILLLIFATYKYNLFDAKIFRKSVAKKINYPIFFLNSLILLVVAVASIIWSRNYFYSLSENYTYDLLNSKAAQVRHYIDKVDEKMTFIVNNEDLLKLLKAESFSPQYFSLLQKLTELFSSKNCANLINIIVFDQENSIVYANHEKIDLISKYTQGEFDKKYITFSNESGMHFYILKSVYDQGSYLGSVAIEANIQEILVPIELARYQKSIGYLYAVNKSGQLITPYQNYQPGKKINTANVTQCVESLNSESEVSKLALMLNQAGQKVYSVSKKLDDVDWCLITEIDEVHLYAPIRTVYLNILIFIVLLVLAMYFIINFVTAVIVLPISKLNDLVQKVEKENYKTKIELDDETEIGSLAKSFDALRNSFLRSRKQVDTQVKNQTEQIEKQRKKLEEQQRAILNVLEDVEDERKVTASERDKIKAILLSIGDGVVVIDKEASILLVNRQAEDLSGYKEKKILNKPVISFFKFINKGRLGNLDEEINLLNFKKHKSIRNSLFTVLITAENTELEVNLDVSEIKSNTGSILGQVIVFRDASEERRIDRMKSEFISLASHQLRTPLSGIKWQIELLQAEKKNLSTDQQSIVKDMEKSNTRMIELVKALLNISRIESGRIIINPVLSDVRELFNSVIKGFEPLIKTKNLHFNLDIARDVQKVVMDPKLIWHVIQNILGNSVKYTPEKGKIVVKVKKDNKDMHVTVEDTGYGVKKEEQSKIFSKFFRGSNISLRHTEGTGLGLYLTKAIIDSSGGKIGFKSVENKGSVFYFSLPLKGVQAKEGEVYLDI